LNGSKTSAVLTQTNKKQPSISNTSTSSSNNNGVKVSKGNNFQKNPPASTYQYQSKQQSDIITSKSQNFQENKSNANTTTNNTANNKRNSIGSFSNKKVSNSKASTSNNKKESLGSNSISSTANNTNPNSNGFKKSTPTPPPPFTLFKTTDLFDQLNYSLKSRAVNTKRSQQLQLMQQQMKENMERNGSNSSNPNNPNNTTNNNNTNIANNNNSANTNAQLQSNPAKTSLIVNKTNNSNTIVKFQNNNNANNNNNNSKKSNFYTDLKNLKIFENVNNEPKSENASATTPTNNSNSRQLLSKSQMEYFNPVSSGNNSENKSFTPSPSLNKNSGSSPKKLLPINKAGIFSSTGNASLNQYNATNHATNANTMLNTNTLNLNANRLIFSDLNLHQLTINKNLIGNNSLVNNENSLKLIRSKSNQNNHILCNNYSSLRSKTINFLLDLNLDAKSNATQTLGPSSAKLAGQKKNLSLLNGGSLNLNLTKSNSATGSLTKNAKI
jgi:hypothetical protein